jgi:hypothetical protein
MEDIGWFKIQVCYNITGDLSNDEELSEVEKIQLRNEGQEVDYEVGWAYFNIAQDPIRQVHPKAFVPKGKTNKKYISEIVMDSGTVYYANEKPERVYEMLNEYVSKFPVTEN